MHVNTLHILLDYGTLIYWITYIYVYVYVYKKAYIKFIFNVLMLILFQYTNKIKYSPWYASMSLAKQFILKYYF